MKNSTRRLRHIAGRHALPSFMATAFMAMAFLLVTIGLAACSEQAAEGTVTPLSAESLLSAPPTNALILDVRTREEFSRGHVPGAMNVPHDELSGRLAEIETHSDQPVIVYCESGRRASAATSTLVSNGFSQVMHLEGDMRGWREAGHPAER